MLNTKALFQRFFRPAARRMAAVGVTANQVTATTMVLSLAAGATVLARPADGWPLLLVPAVLTLRFAFNHIDGLLACEHGMRTDLGAMLNELSDVVSDLALYLPLAAVPGAPAALLVAAAAFGVLTEVAGVAALGIGAARREDGPLGKKPRGLVLGGVAVAMAAGEASSPWLEGVLAVALVLLAVTVVRRMRGALAAGTRA